MAMTIVAAPLSRHFRGRKAPTSQEFVIAAYALGGAIALVKVFIKVVTQKHLQSELDWDGTVAICASSCWMAFLSVKEVVKLF